jgi:phosphatidylinositol glycan class B
MSQISHKEARFIYPLLPCLHLIAGPAVSTFTRRASIWKGFIITVILGLHVYIAYYTSRFHQKGVIDVIDWLRLQHERSPSAVATTAAFLMPCHSTPWRSHLIHPNIDAWALTCEPPVNMVPDDRNEYVDEADVFYNNVREWLSTNMELFASLEKSSIQDQISKHANHKERTINGQITGTNRPWPQYIVVFEQLIPQMWMALPRTENRPYELCQRFANTQWHDDWRRQGMVAVFCLMERDEDGRRVSPSIHYV